MVGGQILDMDCTGKTDVPLETLQTLHALKTGAMFRVACVSGGLLAGASEPDIASLRAYGEALGVTFQIVDDILDETADTATLGKPPEAMPKWARPHILHSWDSTAAANWRRSSPRKPSTA